MKAVVQRRRGKQCRIRAATANDHIGALSQQFDERMHAGHRHDAFRGIEFGLGQIRIAVQAADRTAAAYGFSHALLGDFRIKIAQPERRQLMFFGQRLDHADVHVYAAVRAGVARRADDHGHTQLAGSQQHVLKILPLPGLGAGGGIRAQRDRADIVTARIGRNIVRAGLNAQLKTFGSQRRKAEVAVRADDLQGFHTMAGGLFPAGWE